LIASRKNNIYKKIELAKELKELDISFDKISIATKLSIEEIEK